jgi:hypothetical protein
MQEPRQPVQTYYSFKTVPLVFELVQSRSELDHTNAKWFEMARWKISEVISDHNQRIDTWMVKMWRTVGHSHGKFQSNLDCRVTRHKRLQQLVVTALECSVRRGTQFSDRP